MAYLVLARKYRPQDFDAVVGQQHVTRTLANAINAGRLAHAILFSGPRGTGKTTVARILAKCINCESGPSATPCNECVSCREITAGNSPDVFEIDGASNNKVENIRELRSNARYKPARSPYKIYIIDEVHMLSDSAFNALLKILEEPPAHVLFFFATTEPHKIPVTIHSRCQRYDFRRVPLDKILKHFTDICGREGFEISEKGLSIIAREADGSIRDGLSLLDQVMTCASGKITEADIIDILGVIDRDLLFDISEALFHQDMAKLLQFCDRVYNQGIDLMKFYGQLLAHMRNLMVIRMNGDPAALPDVASFEIDRMKQQVADVPEPYLAQILDTLFESEWRIRQSSTPKLALEMIFFKLLSIKPALSIDSLIERLDALQKGIIADAPQRLIPPKPGPENKSPDHEPAEDVYKRTDKTKQGPKADPRQLTGTSRHETGRLIANKEDEKEDRTAGTMPSREMTLDETWKKLYEWISEKSATIGTCLSGGTLKAIKENRLIIEVNSHRANIHLLELKQTREHLDQLCSKFFKRPMQAEIRIDPEAISAAENKKKERQRLEKECLSHPMVRALQEKLGASIVEVKIKD